MSREERVLTFQRGVSALQAVLDADEAMSPDCPEDSDTLFFLRDVTGIHARLSMVVHDLMEDELGDMMVLSLALEASGGEAARGAPGTRYGGAGCSSVDGRALAPPLWR